MDHVMSDYGPLSAVTVPGLDTGASGPPPRPPDEAPTLSALWTELVSGYCRVEQVEFTAQTCGVVVTRGHRSQGDERAPLPARDIEILERSLLEGVRKSVAADFGLCPSSVAEILRRCFAFMGLSCWPSRIPLLLVMAAHAKSVSAPARAEKVVHQNQQFPRQSISAARPDNELSSWLSPAEFAVTRLLIEGRSYAEVARLRQTSKRTVANQLASAFHRLRISGRAELLCLLAKQKLASWQVPSAVPRTFTLAPAGRAASFTLVAGAQAR
ncbi:MAG: helix-turn-helix transcriptional regulator [Polyangiaceae bacterium]